jgi:hypothetical protein
LFAHPSYIQYIGCITTQYFTLDVLKTSKTITILDISYIFNVVNMARSRDENKTSRNIVLKSETYERLDKYKVKLMGERGTTNVSFDDTINSLLDCLGPDKPTSK